MKAIYRNPLNEDGKGIIFPAFYEVETSSSSDFNFWKELKESVKNYFIVLFVFIVIIGVILGIIMLIPKPKEEIKYFDGTTGYLNNNHSISDDSIIFYEV